MTISTNNMRNEYTATGGQTVFTYGFRIFATDEILVYQTASGSTPSESDLLTYSTDYTLTGVGNVAGGTVVLTSGATNGDLITIVSGLALERETDYAVNGDFYADSVDEDIDRVTSLVKQCWAYLRRVPQFPKATRGKEDLTLPEPVAGEFMRWKSDLSGLESVSLNTLATGDNAAAISYSNSTSGLAATDVQAAIDELENEIDAINTTDLVALSGVAGGSTTLGTFTGSTITDNRTIKQALQELETAHEAAAASTQGSAAATLTGITNVDAVSAGVINYIQIGSAVTFAIKLTVNPTTSGVNTIVEVDPPVASNFAAATDCIGVLVKLSDNDPGYVYADAATNKIRLIKQANGTSNEDWYATGTYYII